MEHGHGGAERLQETANAFREGDALDKRVNLPHGVVVSYERCAIRVYQRGNDGDASSIKESQCFVIEAYAFRFGIAWIPVADKPLALIGSEKEVAVPRTAEGR
jgi:hypothetical protein